MRNVLVRSHVTSYTTDALETAKVPATLCQKARQPKCARSSSARPLSLNLAPVLTRRPFLLFDSDSTLYAVNQPKLLGKASSQLELRPRRTSRESCRPIETLAILPNSAAKHSKLSVAVKLAWQQSQFGGTFESKFENNWNY